jgi:hypothetical protein
MGLAAMPVNILESKILVEALSGRHRRPSWRPNGPYGRRLREHCLLCTITGFYRYAVEEELLDRSPALHVRRPHLDYESHATAAGTRRARS